MLCVLLPLATAEYGMYCLIPFAFTDGCDCTLCRGVDPSTSAIAIEFVNDAGTVGETTAFSSAGSSDL